MTRLVSLALFGVLVAALFLLPPADPARLAADRAGALVAAETEPQGGAEAAELWRALIAHPPARRVEDGTWEVALGEAHVDVAGRGADAAELAQALRRSVVRELRSLAAGQDELGALALAGEDAAAAGGVDLEARYGEGRLELALAFPDGATARASEAWFPPTRDALFPPLIAILLAIAFRRPILALFSGVLVGSILEQHDGGADPVSSVVVGARRVVHPYFTHELTDSFRIEIVLFVVFMLAMVGVITRAGGIQGLMDRIARIAGSARRTQIATSLMGLAIFFDDYANTILVGSTMRPLCDRFRVSREKLAYLVDSTAAPVAGLSIFSTWIAFEVSTYNAQLPTVGLAMTDGYSVFLQTLPYRFYCILAVALVLLVAFTGRDFGPMLAAERRARAGAVLAPGAKPMVGEGATGLVPAPKVVPRAAVALWPLATFIVLTLAAIAYDGKAHTLGADLWTIDGITQVLYEGSGSTPLMFGSGAGLLVAIAFALRAGLGTDVLRAAWSCLTSMWIALVILFLAWMIGAVCKAVGTAPYLTVMLGDAVPAPFVPCLLFLLSGVVAFSTGSSWSTMSILLPLVVGFAYAAGEASDIGGLALMVMSIGAVLEGAIFGDHCSPISDTTVLSSIASASDHIDHVRTQIPYALLTMLVALLCGYVPCAFLGVSPFLAGPVAIGVLALLLRIFGRRADDPAVAAG